MYLCSRATSATPTAAKWICCYQPFHPRLSTHTRQMAASGYEHGDNYRMNAELMDTFLERVLYRPWFKDELACFLQAEADVRKVRLWHGPVGNYWMKPGHFRKYITLVITYDNQKLVFEQNDLLDKTGYFRKL